MLGFSGIFGGILSSHILPDRKGPAYVTDSTNKPEPSKRTRPASGSPAFNPKPRKSVRQQAPKFAPKPKAEQAPKASKPSKPSKVPKLTRTSKIPRTTTTSKAGKTGRISNAPSRPSSSSSPWASQSGHAGAQGLNVAEAEQRAKAREGASKRTATSQFARTPASFPGARVREKGVPQTRTLSTSNEFVIFTKTHLPIMIPLFIIIGLLVIYTCVDICASFGRIHPGVSVQGVDVGGLSVQDASTKINEELSPKLSNAHITIYESDDIAAADGAQVSTGDIDQAYADEAMAGSDVSGDGSIDKWSITAETIGAYVDGQALAEEAYLVGRRGNFIADRFFSWFGGTRIDATVSVSGERFNALAAEINQQIGLPIVDSSVRIEDGAVSVVDGSDGWSVDAPVFIKRFSASAFASENFPFVIPMKTDPMHIKPATAQRVADDVKTAIAENVTIVHDPDTWTLDTADLGDLISQQVLTPDEVLVFGGGTQKVVADGTTVSEFDTSAWVDPDSGYVLQAYVDQEKFDRYLVGILGPAATGGATDAYFDTSSGEVVLVEAVEGYGPDRSAAEVALQTLLFGEPDATTASSRTITLVDVTIQPEITTEKARSMGITERLATWTIPLSGSSQRINNIKLLCQLINNSLVAPGATWSFNGTTGERTAEKGFQTAPVIINGKHEDQLGGGICQIATCIFNAACFSGLGIAERVNHDFYISSYDDYGFADATVSWKSPDLKWVNDMSTYVLMTATVTDEDVVITFWGTKDGRTVECQRGEWKEGDKYVTITEVDPALATGESKVTQNGQDGRSIDIRYLAKAADGTVLHDINFHSIYSAQNEIITVGPDTPAPAASPPPAQ